MSRGCPQLETFTSNGNLTQGVHPLPASSPECSGPAKRVTEEVSEKMAESSAGNTKAGEDAIDNKLLELRAEFASLSSLWGDAPSVPH
jgi:hypothetical protein